MEYERDIKKINKEKNRLARIIEKMGTSPFRIGRTYSEHRKLAEKHVEQAITELHEAELALRRYDW